MSLGAALLREFTDITQFEATDKFRLIEQGYLGQLTNQHDEDFNGCSISITMHVHSADAEEFKRRVKARAQRSEPDLQINATTTYFHPNGQTARVFYPDLKFGPMKTAASSRGDYVAFSFEAACDDSRLLT